VTAPGIEGGTSPNGAADRDADLVIAGAGCAGLSALWQALHSARSDARIVVIDRRIGESDDRTWSFWGPPTAPFADLADRSWHRVQAVFPGYRTSQRIGRSRRGPGANRAYFRVRSRDYSAAILETARRRSNVEFIEADIHSFSESGESGTGGPGTRAGVVSTSVGDVRAPVVLQSVRAQPDTADATVRHPLRQHFGGWEVRTDRPIFDPDCVTLMDFDVPQHDGTAFFYVLPTSPHRALVEYTMFSEHPRSRRFYDDHLRDHLDALGASGYEIERREYGVIPMEDRRHSQRSGNHIWNIGTVGGMTKPTTGYTFQRIHEQTQRLVGAWAVGAPLPCARPASARFGFADRTLLNILHHHPELGRPVFERLFRTSSIDDILTFLDERSTFAADCRMIAGLPWKPFLQAAASELGADARQQIPMRLQWG
jgi:lycopene beta-cyclase